MDLVCDNFVTRLPDAPALLMPGDIFIAVSRSGDILRPFIWLMESAMKIKTRVCKTAAFLMGAAVMIGIAGASDSPPLKVQALHDELDDPTLARRIAAFEKDHHAVIGRRHPVSQFDQFSLQAQ